MLFKNRKVIHKKFIEFEYKPYLYSEGKVSPSRKKRIEIFHNIINNKEIVIKNRELSDFLLSHFSLVKGIVISIIVIIITDTVLCLIL